MGYPLREHRAVRILLLVLALVGRSAGGFAAGYDSLVEQGGFYLDRGATYGADAVRVLEAARDAEPERAARDGRLLSSLARAYALTSRNTEAFWVLEALGRLGQSTPEGDALRSSLLGESGLGRLRLVSAVPVEQTAVRLKPAEGTLLDVVARKTFERLAELLGKGLATGPDGVSLLVPEGRYDFSCESPLLHCARDPVRVEVVAGEESAFRLVPNFPSAGLWIVTAGSRSIRLSWAGLPGATYELAREVGASREVVYRGDSSEYEVSGLPVGARVSFSLRLLGPAGELLATSSVTAETQPPVSRVAVQSALGSDLRMRVAWELGPGTVDRVRVVRQIGSREVLVAEVRDGELLRKGSATDAVILPEKEPIPVGYRVEVWVGDGEARLVASGEARAEIPRRVVHVTEVVQSIERGSIVLQWETLPRDSIAEGYAVYVQRGEAVEGELVARVEDPFAREYLYDVEDPVEASGWRHVVVPYVGDQLLLDPRGLIFRGREPDESLGKRAAREAKLPSAALSWDPYAGAVAYEVTVSGQKTVLVNRPYIEIEGLQSRLVATNYTVKVFAVDADGKKADILSQEIGYRHYPREVRKGGQ